MLGVIHGPLSSRSVSPQAPATVRSGYNLKESLVHYFPGVCTGIGCVSFRLSIMINLIPQKPVSYQLTFIQSSDIARSYSLDIFLMSISNVTLE